MLAAWTMALGVLVVGSLSCNRGANVENDLRTCKDVPAVIADARLLSYTYTLQGDMRWPLHSEKVEICEGDSTRCIIRLFDDSRLTPEHFGADGEPRPDSLVVSSVVLDSIKQMIVDARAWQFKEDYSPRADVMDGNSWGYSATFALTDSLLAATHEPERARLLRQGGVRLSSGGGNASPDTKLFQQVRTYLQSILDAEKPVPNP